MKRFARLIYELDQTNKTNRKVDLLVDYLKAAPEDEAFCAIAILTGRRPKRSVNTALLRMWAAEAANVPMWLFEECHSVVGDLSETISLLLAKPTSGLAGDDKGLCYWINYMRDLAPHPDERRKQLLAQAWAQMDKYELFVFSKLNSSTFRIGISENLVFRAVSLFLGIPQPEVVHRMMGNWSLETHTFDTLFRAEHHQVDLSKPYPFSLAHQLDSPVEELGAPEEWLAEWKWDGIRSQLVFRDGNLYIWSRGEDLVTEQFPEFRLLADSLPPNTVIDGEILPHRNGEVQVFNQLQKRLGRKNPSRKILSDNPVLIYAYDLLEHKGEDIRERPLAERRNLLEGIVAAANKPMLLNMSPTVEFAHWEELAEKRKQAREVLSEGLMLKRKDSPYHTGRKRGNWWKWKIDPLTIDAVLVYANRGTGRRANLYTAYTFAIWQGKQLITFAKAYSGLSDREIAELDKWICTHTVEKFGPVRTVKPEQVFELGFEGIQRSNRHKSGVAVRFPRILRWRVDKPAAEADTIEQLEAILKQYESGAPAEGQRGN